MDVNTLGGVIQTVPTGFISILVQRESLGGLTYTPIPFLFSFKDSDMVAIMLCDPYDNTVLAYISTIVQDKGLVTIIDIYEVPYEVSSGTVSFDLG